MALYSHYVFCVLQETELREQLRRVEGEKDLLSHSLTDRNAELQLQINKTNVHTGVLVITPSIHVHLFYFLFFQLQELEQRLDDSLKTTQSLQHQLQAQNDYLSSVVEKLQSVSETGDGCMAVVNQALTRMANYDHRLNMMRGRINSIKGWQVK